MRPARTPSFLWLPFLFSVGTLSWAILLASAGLLAVTILAPDFQRVRTAERQRNDLQATVTLLDQKIAMQSDFVAETSNPELMIRLASRSLHYDRPDQEVLILDPASVYRDRSVRSLLAESLPRVEPKEVPPLPQVLEHALKPSWRPVLLGLACGGMLLAFLLGVRL